VAPGAHIVSLRVSGSYLDRTPFQHAKSGTEHQSLIRPHQYGTIGGSALQAREGRLKPMTGPVS
jgi:hypothetical protein